MGWSGAARAPVLELGSALARQGLRRERLGEAQRIPQERDLAGRAARHHVVGLDGRLTEQLEDANDAEDLELAALRHGVPRSVARATERLEGDTLVNRKVAREKGAARRNPRPASGSSHGDARVLELASAEPGERLIATQGGEAPRVEHLPAGLRACALPAAGRRRTSRGQLSSTRPGALTAAAHHQSSCLPGERLAAGGGRRAGVRWCGSAGCACRPRRTCPQRSSAPTAPPPCAEPPRAPPRSRRQERRATT